MIIVVLIFAFILRIVSLNQSFWLDEATTGIVARDLSINEFLSNFLPGDFHPPLYYLLVKAWGSVFGFSEISLRAPSLFAGIGIVYVVYLIGKIIRDREAGLVAALLVASAPLLIYYSQEARFYSFTAFLVTLAVYLYLKLLRKPVGKHWFYFSLTVLLIGMSDYLPLLILPVFWLFAFVKKRRKKDRDWIVRFGLSHLPLLAGFLLIGQVFISQIMAGMGTSAAWARILGFTNLKNVALVPVKFLIGRVSFEPDFIYAFWVILIGSVFLYSLSFVRKRIFNRKNGEFLILMWLVVPLLIGGVVGFFVPILQYPRFLFVLPGMYLLVAFGLRSICAGKFLPVFGAALLLNLFFSWRYLTNAQFHRENWREAVSFVNSNSEAESSVVVFVRNSQMEGFRFYDRTHALLGGVHEIEEDVKTVWLVRYLQDVFDPEDVARKSVEEAGYEKISEHAFDGVLMWKYEKDIN